MKFRFYIGGFFGISHEVRYEGDGIYYTSSESDCISPVICITDLANNDHWLSLLKFCDTIVWQKRYDSEALDGTQWEFIYSSDSNKVRSSGNNAFPRDFPRFLKKINVLFEEHDIILA